MRSGLVATVSGRVQGVMYRDFARRKAVSLRLVGEIENLPDGSVRVYAEGEQETLERFVEYLRKGTVLSNVENVAYQLVHPRGGHDTFSIHYT